MSRNTEEKEESKIVVMKKMEKSEYEGLGKRFDDFVIWLCMAPPQTRQKILLQLLAEQKDRAQKKGKEEKHLQMVVSNDGPQKNHPANPTLRRCRHE